MVEVGIWTQHSPKPIVVEATVEIDTSYVTGRGESPVEALGSLHHALMNFGHRIFEMAGDVSKLMRKEKERNEQHGASIRAQPDGEPAESVETQGDGAAVCLPHG